MDYTTVYKQACILLGKGRNKDIYKSQKRVNLERSWPVTITWKWSPESQQQWRGTLIQSFRNARSSAKRFNLHLTQNPHNHHQVHTITIPN